MSKQDSQFFNVFSVVLGLLVVFAIIIFALARHVGKTTQNPAVLEDPMQQQSVEERTALPARVAVAGQDNSALTIAPVTTAGGAVVAATYKDGTEVFEGACKACHGTGLAGAPKLGDAADWGPRAAQGEALLFEHATKGFTGKKGMMPPKGGFMALTDDEIRAAIGYMSTAPAP